MSTITNQTQQRAERLIKQLPTSILIETYYGNAADMQSKRGTAEYGSHMLVHMWISDEITDRLGEDELVRMENITFGELS